MSKLAVIYWSGTGNTEAMAQAVVEGAREAGADASLFSVDQISAADAAGYDRLALGCPAMGAEVLEEAEFEPFFTALEGRLGGKRVALFGTAGFGLSEMYFASLSDRFRAEVPEENQVLGTWFCPGRMPPAVRARYEAQLKEKPGDARLENMLRAYDQALSHPDGTDLADARAFAAAMLAK